MITNSSDASRERRVTCSTETKPSHFKIVILLGQLILACTISSSLAANPCCVRTVSNTKGCNGTSVEYSVWLNNHGIEAYFKGTNYSWEECDGQITFKAKGLKAIEAPGEIIDVIIIYSGYTQQPPSGSPKGNGCGAYNITGWEYYTGTAGSITSNRHGAMSLDQRGPAFQVGKGANTQAQGFGASGWFNISGGDGYWKDGDVNVLLGPCACLLEVTAVPQVETCFGARDGQIDINIIQGANPLKFIWNTGATTEDLTSLGPGNYTVTVTDAFGCTKVKTLSLGAPLQINLRVKTQDILCADTKGQINLSVTGGTPPYTYKWSNGVLVQDVFSLLAGTYTVTVTDKKGCTSTVSGSIQDTPPIQISGDVQCAAEEGGTGSIFVIINGGTAPYSYKWSNGNTSKELINVSVGCYTLTITDHNGCKATYQNCVCQPSVCQGYRTQTEEGWVKMNVGEKGEAMAYLSNNFTKAFPAGLTIGCNKTIRLSSVQAIKDFLPSIGIPSVLGQNYNNPAQNYQNELAGQLVAAVLSVTFDLIDPVFSLTTDNLKDLRIGQGPLMGLSVEQVLQEANKLLGGCSTNYKLEDILDALKNINKNFVGGDVTGDFLVCCNLEVNGSVHQVSCFGGADGQISITLSGGNAPYTFTWSNGATTSVIKDLKEGNYTVTVTDKNGCTSVCEKKVIQPAQILSAQLRVATFSRCHAECNGSLEVIVNGGQSPYTYKWSHGASNKSVSTLCAGSYTVTITDANGCLTSATALITNPDEIKVVSTTEDVSCYGGNDGQIRLKISGGISPYAFKWSHGGIIQDPGELKAGTYTVTVSDANGCQKIVQGIVVRQPSSAINIISKLKPISCYGEEDGMIDLTVSGGVKPYHYLWSNGQSVQDISALPAGTYQVTVSDKNSCTMVHEVELIQPSPLLVKVNKVEVSCFGEANGVIRLEVVGGNGEYHYTWSNGATTDSLLGLKAGVYHVTVMDKLWCTLKTEINITEPQKLICSVSSTQVSCYGGSDGSATVDAGGGNGTYRFHWSNGSKTNTVKGLKSGKYFVTTSDSKGCSVVCEVLVGEPASLNCLISADHVICHGGNDGQVSVKAAGGNGDYHYLWSGGETSSQITGVKAGDYRVTVTDKLGCITACTVTIFEPEKLSCQISTKPVTCAGAQNGTVEVRPKGGSGTYTYRWNNGFSTSTMEGLAPGKYIVTVTDANGCHTTCDATVFSPEPLICDLKVKASTCLGAGDGILEAQAQGGTGNYYYKWSTGHSTKKIENLSSGIYHLTITDGLGCSTFCSAKVSEPPALACELVTKPLSCHGSNDGEIRAEVQGGNGDYQFKWSTGQTAKQITKLPAGTYAVTITDKAGCSTVCETELTEPTDLTIKLLVNHVECYGESTGKIVAEVHGSEGAIKYFWSHGATIGSQEGLKAGKYTLSVTDRKGCTAVAETQIAEPPPLVIEGKSVEAVCFGESNGTISINTKGGTFPYRYQWSNGETTQNIKDLKSGVYIVTVTDQLGCSAVQPYEVKQPNVITGKTSATEVNCKGDNNGKIDLIVKGGTPPYRFKWSTGSSTQSIAGLVAGIYAVTITDANGCSIVLEDNVENPSDLSIKVTELAAICNGTNTGGAKLEVAGGVTPYAYNWSNGSTLKDLVNVFAGTFTVTVSDKNSCQSFAKVVISQPDALKLKFEINSNPCEEDASSTINLTVNGGVAPYRFYWNHGATTSNISNLSSGEYQITVTDKNGCSITQTETIRKPIEVSVKANKEGDFNCQVIEVQLFANGSEENLTYSWSGPNAYVSSTRHPKITKPGVYVVTATRRDGCIATDTVSVESSYLPPVVNIKVLKNLDCTFGSKAVLEGTSTANGASLSWSGPNGFSASGKSVQIATEGVYVLAVKGLNGCIGKDSIAISLPNAPLFMISGEDINCLKDSVTLSVQTKDTGLVYDWRGPGGYKADDPAVVIGAAGWYIVRVTSSLGCENKDSIFIDSVQKTLEFEVQGGTLTCAKNEVSLVVQNQPTDVIFKWTGPNGFNSNLPNPKVREKGKYMVTITDAKGCTGTATGEVLENKTPPELKGEGGTLNCKNTLVQLKAVTTAKEPQFLWTGPANFISREQNPVVSRPGIYTVTLEAQGCINQAVAEVKADLIEPGFSIEPSSLTISCGSENTQIILHPDKDDQAYVWIGPENFVSTDQNLLISQPGRYVVTVTGSNGCTSQKQVTIVEKQDLHLIIRDVVITCSQPGVYLEFVNSNLVKYFWSGPNNFRSDAARPLINQPGIYTLMAQDASGCRDTATIDVKEDTREPNVQVQGGVLTCGKGLLRLLATADMPGVSYQWKGPQNFTSNLQNPEVSVPGDYYVEVIANNGCAVITKVTVLEEACARVGNRVWLDTNCNGVMDGSEEKLTVMDRMTIQLYSCSNALVAEVITTDAGDYIFEGIIPDQAYFIKVTAIKAGYKLTIPHAGDEEDLDSDVDPANGVSECFTLRPGENRLNVDIGLCLVEEPCDLTTETSDVHLACGAENVALNLKLNIDTSLVTISWQGPEGFFSSYLEPLVYRVGQYIVTVMDDHGCKVTDTLEVFAVDKPDIQAESGHILCSQGRLRIHASTSIINPIFEWVGPVGFRSNLPDPYVTEPGLYTVIVTGAELGCWDKKTIVVTAECCNVINGGLIAGNETGCGVYDPDMISNVMLPSGGMGKTYYQWMRTTDPKLPIDQWIPIFGAHKESYDPGPISETTYYARCSRKGVCDKYVGETNVVVKEVQPELRLITDSLRIYHETACGLSDGKINISMNDSRGHGPWMVQVDVEGKTLFYGPFKSPSFVISKLKPGKYSQLQIMNGIGCTSNILPGELLVEAAQCNIANSPTVNLLAYPNPSSEQITLIIQLPREAVIKSLEMLESTGRVVNKPLLPKLTPYLNGYRTVVEIGDMNDGLYYLRLITSKGVQFAPLHIVK